MASRKTSGIVAFEFRPDSLRYAELSPDGHPENQVLTVGVLSFEPGDHSVDLADRLRSVLDRTSAFQPGSRGGLVVASVPYRHAFVRRIELPEVGEDLDEHVRWDMSQYLARPLAAYALDHRPAPVEGRPGALVAAYRLSEIDSLRRLLSDAGAPPPAAVDIDALAVLNAFAANYPECLSERTVILKVDDAATVLIRTRHGAFEGATVLREPEEPSTDAGPHERAERLLRRARRIASTLDDAGSDAAPERVFLCGDLAADLDFRELLKTARPAPFALLNPFRKIPGPNPDLFPEAYPGAPFAAVVGLALRAASERSGSPLAADPTLDLPRLDLLRGLEARDDLADHEGREDRRPVARTDAHHGEHTGERKASPARRLLVAAAILLLAIAAAVYLRAPQRFRFRAAPAASAAPAAPAKADSLQAALDAEASRLIAGQRNRALAWLREMEAALPFDSLAGIRIQRIVFSQPDAFVIRGTARSDETLSNLQESLVLVPGLDLRRSEARPAAHGSKEFQFSGTFTVPPDTAPTAPRVLVMADSNAALARFLESASFAGTAFSPLPAAAPTVSGTLRVTPYRLTARYRPVLLREFLENESRSVAPFGIQRILLENNGDSIVVFLDIMAFSR